MIAARRGAFGSLVAAGNTGREPAAPLKASFFCSSCEDNNKNNKAYREEKEQTTKTSAKLTSAWRISTIEQASALPNSTQKDFIKFHTDLHKLREVIPRS
jgi:hypothetical protein